jgi:hypothetical protein
VTRRAQEMNRFKPRNPSTRGGLAAMIITLLRHCRYSTARAMLTRPAWRRAGPLDVAKVAYRRSGGRASAPSSGLTDDAKENAHVIA